MQRLGKNHGGYHGETIDIRAVLREVEIATQKFGWHSEIFHEQDGFKWLALHHPSSLNSQPSTRIYISTGIHGDEPEGLRALVQLAHLFEARPALWWMRSLAL